MTTLVRLVCRLVGHDWEAWWGYDEFPERMFRTCYRCGRSAERIVFAHPWHIA